MGGEEIGEEIDKRDISAASRENESEVAVSSSSRGRKRKKMDSAEIAGREFLAILDLDLIDCPICFEPPQPPLFQCRNGHIACSSCILKLQDKCPSCSQSINYSRCVALEKIIESVKVPCSYAADGCKAMISYLDQLQHEHTCIYAPCVCPMPNCNFSGSTELLSTHVGKNHQEYVRFIPQYDVVQRVAMSSDVPFLFILGPLGKVFLLLNMKDGLNSVGNSLSMVCISPQAISEDELMYELRIRNKGNYLLLNASMTNVKEWKGCYPTDAFLVVPT